MQDRRRPVASPAALLMLACSFLACAMLASANALAQTDCDAAVTSAERENALPANVLRAISLVESGRRDPATGRLIAWPWSVNVAGEDHVFDTKAQAIAFVQDAEAHGIRSLDVGCMQVNLMYHPAAFASLDDAFDPAANVRYATAFLLALRHQTGDWMSAVGDYHSRTLGRSADYARRVAAVMGGDPPVLASSPPKLPPAAFAQGVVAVQIIVPGIRNAIVPVHASGAANLPRIYYPGR